MFEIWTSTTGAPKALSASSNATDVWVKARGIDDDAAGGLARLVDPVDEFVFAVALEEAKFELQFGAERAAIALDVVEGLAAVNLWLALAEQIEIGAVEKIDDAAHAGLSHG